jgi:hypothetical protein
MVTRNDVLTLNGTPYVIRRRVWFGRFIDNLNGGQVRNDLIELWKEYTESDQVYQEGEAILFLQEIKEPEWEEIL